MEITQRWRHTISMLMETRKRRGRRRKTYPCAVVDGDESAMVVSLLADGSDSEMEGMSNVFDGEMEPGEEGGYAMEEMKKPPIPIPSDS
ncbi:hypothetical protein Dimus_018953, partial [Dionaea muscipula]